MSPLREDIVYISTQEIEVALLFPGHPLVDVRPDAFLSVWTLRSQCLQMHGEHVCWPLGEYLWKGPLANPIKRLSHEVVLYTEVNDFGRLRERLYVVPLYPVT